jgi:hypothetical protein
MTGGGNWMKTGRALLLSVLVLHFSGLSCVAEADALHEASVVALNDRATETVPLRSTDRLLEASGAVRLERKGGTTEIEVELDSMKPAVLFGGDYNTYVLWVVPPGGPAANVTEITLDGSRATAHAATSAPEFAILVTAEPHYLVGAPSAFLVLENEPGASGRKVEQPLIEGVYNFDRSSLDDVKRAKGRVHTEVRQAVTAVRLAQRAGAPSLASPEFAQARRALQRTITLWKERTDRAEIAAQARETVRLAVAAQRLAHDRALQGNP